MTVTPSWGYVKEAPLQALTATTKLKMQQACRKHGDLLFSGAVGRTELDKVKADWENRLAKLTDELRHLRSLRSRDLKDHEDIGAGCDDGDSLLSLVDRRAILNLTSGKVHLSTARSSKPGSCVSLCGWQYGYVPHTTSAAATSLGRRCKRCWKRVTATPAARDVVSDSTASSSSSSESASGSSGA